MRQYYVMFVSQSHLFANTLKIIIDNRRIVIVEKLVLSRVLHLLGYISKTEIKNVFRLSIT